MKWTNPWKSEGFQWSLQWRSLWTYNNLFAWVNATFWVGSSEDCDLQSIGCSPRAKRKVHGDCLMKQTSVCRTEHVRQHRVVPNLLFSYLLLLGCWECWRSLTPLYAEEEPWHCCCSEPVPHSGKTSLEDITYFLCSPLRPSPGDTAYLLETSTSSPEQTESLCRKQWFLLSSSGS